MLTTQACIASKRCRRFAAVILLSGAGARLCGGSEAARESRDVMRVDVSDRTIAEIRPELFGQFMERAAGGETGPEAAVDASGAIVKPVRDLLAGLLIPVVRFPGGTSVDYIDWRDLIENGHGEKTGRAVTLYRGNADTRLTNRFGYDEFFRLAGDMKWKTLLVLNFRSGLLETNLAAAVERETDLLRYLTAPDGEWAKRRAANGHPQPYRPDYVQIGNETWFFAGEAKKRYGDGWEDAWVKVLRACIRDIRELAPKAQIVTDEYPLEVSARLTAEDGPLLFTLHRYHPMGISRAFGADGRELAWTNVADEAIWDAVVHCTETDEQGQARWADKAIDQALALGHPMVMTEWNLNGWWDGSPPSRYPGYGAGGVGAAVMLHAMLRHGNLFRLATQSMLVGRSWGITGIRVFPDSDREPVLFPSLRATDFYRRHHARFLLATTVSSGGNVFDLGLFTGKAGAPTGRAAAVDVVAMRDERSLRIFAINTARTREAPCRFVLPAKLSKQGEWRRVSMQFALRGEEKDADLRVEETATTCPLSALDQPLLLPPRSITLLEVPWMAD